MMNNPIDRERLKRGRSLNRGYEWDGFKDVRLRKEKGMAAKPMILRELEKLPVDALEEVERFVGQLKRSRNKSRAAEKQGRALVKKQVAAIQKWAGKDLGPGFVGRSHDEVLYGDKR